MSVEVGGGMAIMQIKFPPQFKWGSKGEKDGREDTLSRAELPLPSHEESGLPLTPA